MRVKDNLEIEFPIYLFLKKYTTNNNFIIDREMEKFNGAIKR